MTHESQRPDYSEWVRNFATQRFEIARGEFLLDGRSLAEFSARVETPFYVYSEAILKRTWHALRSAFPAPLEIYYSIKANPNQCLLRFLLDRVDGLEVASLGELHLAMAADCPPAKIVFAGPGKRDEELQAAIQHHLAEIHVESTGELARLQQLAKQAHQKVNVAIRVNPSLASAVGSLQMGGKPTQFGIDEESLGEAVRWAETECPHLQLVGLHLNTGTQLLDAEILLAYYQHAIQLATRVAKSLGRRLETLDFGGGLGIPYHPGQVSLDMEALRTGIGQLTEQARACSELAGTRLMIEPGRFLVAEAGLYITRILDIKRSRGEKFVILDGGMHHHLAATGNLGQTLKRPFPLLNLSRLDEAGRETVTLVGPLCTPLDTFARRVVFPTSEVGDIVAILQSGAYARTSSPLHFLGHATPAEYWMTHGQAQLIRRRGEWRDELSDQVSPPLTVE